MITTRLRWCTNPIFVSSTQRALSVRQRVEKFLQVMRAVQYAHSNLTIHRDLKPSNIIVTSKGDVKLLDFGIAKLLDRDTHSTTKTELTQ